MWTCGLDGYIQARVSRLRTLACALILCVLPRFAEAEPPKAPLPRGPAALKEASRLHEQIEDLIKVKGRYDEALELAQRALAICEKNMAPDDPRLAQALHDAAEAQAQGGVMDKAEPLYRRALAIYEKNPGKDQMDLGRLLDDFASALTGIQKLDEAEAMFGRVLAIAKAAPGAAGKKMLAQAMNNMAGLHYYRGNYTEAIALFQEGLGVMEQTLGPDDPAIATAASNLAAVLDALGRGAEAKPFHLRALSIREKIYGPDHPTLASSLSNLGVLTSDEGDYVKATELHERALSIREKALGPEHPSVAVSLNNLASVWEDRGDSAKARALYERALAIADKKLGAAHPTTVQILHNYAVLLMGMQDRAVEAPLLRLMEIQRKKDPKTFDLRSMDTSLWLAQLALGIDMSKEARELAELVLEAIEAKLGPNNYRGALCLSVIAGAYEQEGDSKRAGQLFEQAIARGEKALGQYHPQFARLLWKQVSLLARPGSIEKALDVAERASEIDERNLRTVLGAGSESQKRAYSSANALNADRAVSLHAATAPQNPRALRLGLLTVLRRKGRVLDALVDGVGALRRRLSSEDAKLLDDLAAFRGVLARTSIAPPTTPQERLLLEGVEQRIEELEARISEQSADFRLAEAPIRIQAVQASIPRKAALVEVFLWHPIVKNQNRSKRYLAYVLQREGEPRFVDLGETKAIDEAANKFLGALRDPNRKDVLELGRALDEKTMRPIRGQLGEARQIIFSPDGMLNLVPIGSLVDEKGKFLVQDYSISYVVSGRDLMRMGARVPARSPDVVIANPIFGSRAAQGEEPSSTGERKASGLSGAFFGDLPGTGEEAEAIGKIFPGARVLTQGEATEKAFKELHGPRLLHVATHGFFLKGAETARKSSRGLDLELDTPHTKESHAPNPLIYSGLALSQANSRPGEGEDGILTALEASGLDLWGTKLVVLSACETGLGELENGEGVSGLRRALFTAGAESAIMSLWKVDDEATRDLMIDIYARLSKGSGRAESLRQAQLGLLGNKNFGHPYFWASFVEVGDYSNLDGEVVEPRLEAARVAPSARGCACGLGAEGGDMEWLPGALGLLAMGMRRRKFSTTKKPWL